MEMEGGKVVCVTGASGYIASWLVKLLLDRGYTVKPLFAPSVDVSKTESHDPKKTDHLLSLDRAKDRLQVFEANLLEEGSFDAAIDGCDGVFHTACPVFLSVSNPQEELIDPTVKGTVNVLKSCLKNPSVKRVVMTSSMASVYCNGKPLNADVVIDETWFSDPAFCEASKQFYHLSKTLADAAAYKLAKEHGIDLITLHPGFVIGPLLQPSLNLSSEGILNLMKNGTNIFPDGIYRLVDVRDVANAHILALETPSANGRYCLVGKVTHSSDVLKILHELYPSLDLPKGSEDEKIQKLLYQISRQKAKSIGIKFTPLEVTLSDTFEDFKLKKLLTF